MVVTTTWLTQLCFHGIGSTPREREPGESAYWVRPGMFRRLLDVVAERTDVALTFDDGNASDVEIALPELRARGLTAAFFPVAARLGSPGNLSPGDLRELVAAGMTVGSHGMAHRSWRRLRPEERVSELELARQVIEQAAGAAVDSAACPLGEYDRAVLRDLRRRRYRTVYTSDRVRARRGAWLQPRFSVRGSDTVEDVQALLAHRESRARRAAARARLVAKGLR